MERAVVRNKYLPYVDKIDRWSSHAWLSRRLGSFPPGTRVLDVGAASGTLGRVCTGRNFILHGLEPEAAWAEKARPYYGELLCSSLDAAPESYLKDHDVIVLGDVLEHMADPLNALRHLAGLQPPEAVFLISVPNVAHLWVRLNLLLGHFDYTERGILDRTHLRFFTRRTLRTLLADAGLDARRIDVSPIPLNLVHPFFERHAVGRLAHRLLAGLSSSFPTLLGYQFLVEAGKAHVDI